MKIQNPRARAERRSWPIHGYVGPNGSGKSACMVWDTLPSLEAGRPVLSTVRLLDYENPRDCDDSRCAELNPDHFIRKPTEMGKAAMLYNAQERALFGKNAEQLMVETEVVGVHRAAHPLYIPLRHHRQILEARGVDVLLDEVTGVASSRESASLPAPVANRLVQLRRADVLIRWSAPSWARADLIIRECSQAVTYARGMFATAHEDGDRMWRRKRLFRWSTYDATEFEDFTAGKREDLPRLSAEWHWGPTSPAFLAYDTDDSVSSIGSVTDAGKCYDCGGTRRAPKCSCADQDDAAAPAPAPVVVAGGGARKRSGTPYPAAPADGTGRHVALVASGHSAPK